jgi:hypothetical protein
MGPGAVGTEVTYRRDDQPERRRDLKTIPSPNVTERELAVLPLQIDASLDSDVVYHEYGHGLSWRMIGHMERPARRCDRRRQLRRHRDARERRRHHGRVLRGAARSESGRALCRVYEDLCAVGGRDGEVHFDGEIYAAIVWRMIELFGARRDDLFNYVVDGMNFTPSQPTYEQMRDGILASVANGSTPSDCSLVWQAFAQFGVGVGAHGELTGKKVVITESFNVPENCVSP